MLDGTGGWYITSNFQGRLELKGPLFKSGNSETVKAKTDDKGYQLITGGDWIKTAQNGLDSLMVRVKNQLK